jgi:hypothetical protein
MAHLLSSLGTTPRRQLDLCSETVSEAAQRGDEGCGREIVVKTGRWRPGARRAEVLGLPSLRG